MAAAGEFAGLRGDVGCGIFRVKFGLCQADNIGTIGKLGPFAKRLRQRIANPPSPVRIREGPFLIPRSVTVQTDANWDTSVLVVTSVISVIVIKMMTTLGLRLSAGSEATAC